MEADHEYFSRRAFEERKAADNATNEQARKAHHELAARYVDLADAIVRHRVAAE